MSTNHEDYTIEELLGPVNHGLTMGNKMNAANFAFTLLCDKLGIDRDDLEYRPGWSHKKHVYQFVNTMYRVLEPGEYRRMKPGHDMMYRCIMCGRFVFDEEGKSSSIPDHGCKEDLEMRVNV